MSDENHKTLCTYVENERQVKDPQAYIALDLCCNAEM